MPRDCDLFRGARRERPRAGGGRPGHPQPRQEARLPEDHLRRRLSKRRFISPLPVLVCLRWHERCDRREGGMAAGAGGRAPRGQRRGRQHRRGDRRLDFLSQHRGLAAMGGPDAARRPYRPSHLLRALPRPVELTERRACWRWRYPPDTAVGSGLCTLATNDAKRRNALNRDSAQRGLSMQLTDFNTLTFDCYGTLIDWESGIIENLRPLTSRVGRA